MKFSKLFQLPFVLTFLIGISLFATPLIASEAWKRVEKTGELRWGADLAGGAPYVYPDPDHPERPIGFEVDMMEAIVKRLGVKSRLVSVEWAKLVPALLRDDFDLVLNGLEVTEDRRQAIDFSDAYYIFSEAMTVRADEMRVQTFKDLEGKRVGTLAATLAQNILEANGKIQVVPYPSPVESMRDLLAGRLDATLLDYPIASFYLVSGLKNLGEKVGEGTYASGIRKDSPILRGKINQVLHELWVSGELEAIYRKWKIWNVDQERIKNASASDTVKIREKISVLNYLPLILKGACVTLILSYLSMMLAMAAGFWICLSKMYGPPPVKWLASAYIEVVRGTPLLIQLYLLYYGLPNIGIQLNAFFAAWLGLGLNYAAYEAEIYRAGLLSIPKGQDEAARSLGMTGWQSLRYVLIPQAVRTILPPTTNDFIALFKDTSLVSIITVTELTRAYSESATTTYRFLELGLLTALLYFLMSFPLSLWLKRLEKSQNVLMH